MIVFDLSCPAGHRFEGWFASSDDFGDQQRRGFLSCPHCGSAGVEKAPMAPAVPRKGNQVAVRTAPSAQPVAGGKAPPELQEIMGKLAAMQAEVLKTSQWVGDKFAKESRAMHYGEREAGPIHGQASLAEAKELFEEGIAVAPLPFPVAPPDDIN